MLYLALLVMITLFFLTSLKKGTRRGLIKKEIDHDRLKKEYEKAAQENARLKKDNAGLEKSVEETIALYDITKDMRKILDEDRIFNLFKERVKAFFKIDDCRFLRVDSDVGMPLDQTVIPLITENENEPMGYLVAKGIQEKDKEKFKILAQQFISGIWGAFLFKKVQKLAVIDSLTQTFNRRYFLERFQEEASRCQKFKLKFSFAMADIDHFKEINDRFGHLVGDAVLKEIAKVFKENIREIDFMGRYGGEELSVVLTETDKEQGRYACERIRHAIESKPFRVYDEELRVTVSIGLSTFPYDAKNAEALIEKADEALYQAKELGRNRVCIYTTK
ncbi:MAG: GGDEF domain-containing protein [Candidatus Omnitrophota bacterium]